MSLFSRRGVGLLSLAQRCTYRSMPLGQRFFSKYPEHLVLEMPALSPTMERGNIVAWVKQVGDRVQESEVMADVETDKATVAFEAVEEGYLAKILVGDGATDIEVGTPVAILAEEEGDIAAFADYVSEAGEVAAPPAAEAVAAVSAPAAAPVETTPAVASGGRVVASPAARVAAAASGVDLAGVGGTGPGRRIVKEDVLSAASQAPAVVTASSAAVASPAPVAGAAGEFVDIPHTSVRRVIAQRLTESKRTVPHYYLSVDVQMDAVLKLRAELNAQQPEGAPKLSVNDFIIKALALACKKVPEANSAWMDDAIRQYNYVDVSVAVSTDNGLITPIVVDADLKGISAISSDVKRLAAAAREGKLQPHQYQGGTVTLSNLGMFGVKNFSAIINPPQACILAVGGSEQRVVPSGEAESASLTASPYKTATFMGATLSCDHRVVDGAVGAQWLAAFKGHMEKPMTMLL